MHAYGWTPCNPMLGSTALTSTAPASPHKLAASSTSTAAAGRLLLAVAAACGGPAGASSRTNTPLPAAACRRLIQKACWAVRCGTLSEIGGRLELARARLCAALSARGVSRWSTQNRVRAGGGQAESVLWIVDRPRKWATAKPETVMHGNQSYTGSLSLKGSAIIQAHAPEPHRQAHRPAAGAAPPARHGGNRWHFPPVASNCCLQSCTGGANVFRVSGQVVRRAPSRR